MKLLKFNPASVKDKMNVISISIMLLLFIAGCNKEEQLRMLPGKKTAAHQGMNDIHFGQTISQAYQLIKIDYRCGNSSLPDYSFTIYSDSSVVYEGRYNVAVKGTVRFNIPGSTFDNIKNGFLAYHLNTAQSSDEDPRDRVRECPRFFLSNRLNSPSVEKNLVGYTDFHFEKAAPTGANIIREYLHTDSFVYGKNSKPVIILPNAAPIYPVIKIGHLDGQTPSSNYLLTVYSNDSVTVAFYYSQEYVAIDFKGKVPHSAIVQIANEFSRLNFASARNDERNLPGTSKIVTTYSPVAGCPGKTVMFYNDGTIHSMTLLTTLVEAILINALRKNSYAKSKRPASVTTGFAAIGVKSE